MVKQLVFKKKKRPRFGGLYFLCIVVAHGYQNTLMVVMVAHCVVE